MVERAGARLLSWPPLINHLLVTNDFPPKIGGIQTYLWELWRRLPAAHTTVMCGARNDAADFDAAQPFRVVRDPNPVLLPHPRLGDRIDALAREVDAELVLLDPALPVGWLGPSLERPYGLVLHGAEITVPGRLPPSRMALRRVLLGARLIIAAGTYPAAEAERAAGRSLPIVIVPPGVDTNRFVPIDDERRRATRVRHGLDPDRPLVLGGSRLVPRKGFDRLIEAVSTVRAQVPGIQLAISGAGRDRSRLERVAQRVGVAVKFLGRLPDDDMPDLYGCADVYAMLCRNRWAGLEQEGFGIVFLEAAAAGVSQLAGASGGSADAVVSGETGVVVDRPDDADAVASALAGLLTDPDRAEMGRRARERAVAEYDYDLLAARLEAAIAGALSATTT